MSTMKYKMRDRYSFGYADPRGVFGSATTIAYAARFGVLPTVVMGHYARDMTNDQLKAAWVLVYGDRPVTFEEIKRKWAEDETGDDMRVAQETHLRGLLLSQHDFASFTDIYVLKEKLDASN